MIRILALGLISALLTGAAVADKAVATRAGCMGCHAPDKPLVGPSIKAIADKYKTGGKVDELVAVVKAGKTPDQLSWGKIPMPPSPATEADVKTVVEWMLTH